MYCINCGIKISKNANFCYRCGTNISAKGVPATANEHEIDAHSNQQNLLNIEVRKYYGVRGWLLFICISMVIISPLSALGALSSLIMEVNNNWLLYTYNIQNVLIANGVAAATLVLLSIYFGLGLWRKKVGSDKNTKVLLLIFVAYAAISPALFLFYGKMTGEIRAHFILESTLNFLVALSSSVIWYIYLTKSKRVYFTIPKYDTHVRCPDCRKLTPEASTICVHCACRLAPLNPHKQKQYSASQATTPPFRLIIK